MFPMSNQNNLTANQNQMMTSSTIVRMVQIKHPLKDHIATNWVDKETTNA